MQLKIGSFLNGAVEERAEKELKRIVKNMMDPNTNTNQRKLSIEFKITPSNDRKTAKMEFVVKSKLQPAQAVGTTVAIGRTKNGYDAAEIGNQIPGQLSVDMETGEVQEGAGIVEDEKKNNKVRIIG